MMISASLYRICNSASSKGTNRLFGELILLKESAEKKNFRINGELAAFNDNLEPAHARTQSEINIKLSRRASFETGNVVNNEP